MSQNEAQRLVHIRSLATQLGQALQEAGWTLSTAESCTGGGIAAAVTDIAGSSAWFHQGWVTYSNAAKHSLLGVEEATLIAHGAVSEAVVRQMAEGARLRSGAQLALAVSGIAGPGGGSEAKPVGTVWLAWAQPGNVETVCCHFPGDRITVRQRAIQRALEEALRCLASVPRLRQLDLSDVAQATALWTVQQAAYRVEAGWLGVSDFPPLRASVADLQACGEQVLGCYLDEVLVAAVGWESPAPRQRAINRLVVHPDHFRKGLARRLLQWVLRDQQRVYVTTGLANQAAIAAYRQAGFVLDGTMTHPDGIALQQLRYVADNAAASDDELNRPADLAGQEQES
ncbi:nicotinamide-nucleotide amidohydrolase family protein [Leeia aquatica]|uniref:Nicotinamide-nucleotide amidohydrolase family protein n=1 Tax=Leeia aquatica TaxID=2725557 RepID=A0A847SD50_9NEIS|nr:nicotinamide-nucleotide amidohydrolase family protein [Leeia aquatica]NLR75386.1 nicotinamide-nucleotide amidohydrolase family protein [Leeia aquatica]